MHDRNYYIDWLRVFAVILLIPYHTAMIFVTWPFHLKNDVLCASFDSFNGFINLWHMPLFFLIAGAGTSYALKYRTVVQFIKERYFRLFIPLFFGILILIPPQVYLERIQGNQFSKSFFSFYPYFFNGIYPDGNFSWNHLWFLAYLFTYSLLALPIIIRIKNWLNSSKSNFMGTKCSLYLMAVPLVIIQFFLRVKWPNGNQNLIWDWANFLFYLTIYIYGFIIFSSNQILDLIEKNRRQSLTISLMMLTIILIIISGNEPHWSYNIWNMTLLGIEGFITWCILLSFLGYARKYLNFNNRFLLYSNEAVLPFYILHQTIIIITGFYIIQYSIGVCMKFIAICFVSFLITLIIFDVLIKRFFILRFIFGMKSKR